MQEKLIEAAKNIEFPSVELDISSLVDIRSVYIDASRPVEEKKLSLVNQLGNPRCFRYDKRRVRLSFTNKGVYLGDLMMQYFLSQPRLEFEGFL